VIGHLPLDFVFADGVEPEEVVVVGQFVVVEVGGRGVLEGQLYFVIGLHLLVERVNAAFAAVFAVGGYLSLPLLFGQTIRVIVFIFIA